MEIAIYVMLGTGLVLIISQSLPLFAAFIKRFQDWHAKKEVKVTREMEAMYVFNAARRFTKLYVIVPVVLAAITGLIFKNPLFALVAAVLGLGVPTLILRQNDKFRKMKFQSQLMDGINIISSCLKSGLSLVQAIEVLTEEMPAPISQEFGYVTKEMRMGKTLEESLKHLTLRMRSDELELVVNSILIGRETGGDLTKVFSRLITTFRDRQKLKETIRTLTLQGKIQGIIMSFIPILFAYFILLSNKHHFDIMLHTDLGRLLLFVAGALQIVGMFLIQKFSKIEV